MNLNFCEIGEMTDEELLQIHCLFPHLSENKFTGHKWVMLLKSKPELAIHCEWHKLDKDDWFRLLMRHPKFAEHCDKWDLAGSKWVELLTFRSGLAKYCNWDELDGSDWERLLRLRPEFAKYCNWNKLNYQNWQTLLRSYPEFAEHCGWKWLDDQGWVRLLIDRPEFAEHCDWKRLERWDWVRLLIDRPEFAEHCDWKKLQGQDWVELLTSHPEFAEHCDWKKLQGWDWLRLLASHPEFAEFCHSDSLNDIYRTTLWRNVPLELGAKYFRFDLAPLTRIRWQQIKKIQISNSNMDKPAIAATSFFLASWLRSSDNFSLRFKFAFQPIFLLHRKFSKRDRNKYDFPTESPGEFWIQYDIARDLYKKHFQALLTHHKWEMLEKLLQLDAQKFIQVLPFKTLFLPLLFAAPESLIMNVIKAYENNVKKKIAEFHDKRGNNMLHYLFVRLLDECPAWVFNPPEEYRVMEEFLIANGADPAEKNLMQLSYLDCMEYFRSALQEQKC